MKVIAILVVVALTLVCLGDVAQAFISVDAPPACSTWMCIEGACGTSASSPAPPALAPIASLPIAEALVPPAPELVLVSAPASGMLAEAPVLTLAARSPPASS